MDSTVLLKKLLEKYIKKVMSGEPVSSISVAGKEYNNYEEAVNYINGLKSLERKGVIKIKFSKVNEMRVERVYLVLEDEKIDEAERIVKNADGTFQTMKQRKEAINKKQKETEGYSEIAKSQLDKNEKMARLLNFLEKNKYDMYVREISQALVSDTKKIKKDDVIKAIELIEGKTIQADEQDVFMRKYHVVCKEEKISLKGNIVIETANGTLDISSFTKGVDFSADGLKKSRIIIKNKDFITIENLYSYERFNGMPAMYLGGFASNTQIEILKNIKKDNDGVTFHHFGDIDVGGFLILNDLRKKTGIEIREYLMDRETLLKFKKYSKNLTENDKKRLNEDDWLLQEGVKVEQEIISIMLMAKNSDKKN